MSAAKSGHTAPHQYRATPSVNVESPARVAPAKAHPWRAFNPGWLSSDYQHGQRVIPSHARIVRR